MFVFAHILAYFAEVDLGTLVVREFLHGLGFGLLTSKKWAGLPFLRSLLIAREKKYKASRNLVMDQSQIVQNQVPLQVPDENVISQRRRRKRKTSVVHQVEASWRYWNNTTKVVIIASFLALVLVLVLVFNAGGDSGGPVDNSVDNSVSPDNQAAWLLGAVAVVGLIVLGVIAFQFLKKGETVEIVSKILGKAEKEGENFVSEEGQEESKIEER
jgi:disulfide bond formation protein DsbB